LYAYLAALVAGSELTGSYVLEELEEISWAIFVSLTSVPGSVLI